MTIIGINGPTGSGKTTVAENILKDSNKKIIYLDQIFDINKKALGIKSYKRIKKILVNKYLKKEIETAKNSNIGYLIIESSRLELYDIKFLMTYLIFVSASCNIRLERKKFKDEENLSQSFTYYKLINEDVLNEYDFKIDNDGNLEQLIDYCNTISNTIISNKPKSKFKACKLSEI